MPVQPEELHLVGSGKQGEKVLADSHRGAEVWGNTWEVFSFQKALTTEDTESAESAEDWQCRQNCFLKFC